MNNNENNQQAGCGIFDFFGIIGAIINPASNYEEMKDKIESDKEDKKYSRKGKSITSFLKRLFE